jgi:hypothetical protein
MSDEKTGYKRPPKAHRFKQGESGNPRGRPKARRNVNDDLAEMLNKPIQVRENGKLRWITQQQALLLRLFEQGMAGDVKSIANIISILRQQPTWTDQADLELITGSDRKIIEDFLRRNAKEPNDDDLSSS